MYLYKVQNIKTILVVVVNSNISSDELLINLNYKNYKRNFEVILSKKTYFDLVKFKLLFIIFL